MNCKTCGTPIEEGANACRNCGTTLAEMGIFPTKVKLKKDDRSEFQKRAAQFGTLEVKEKKASLLAGIDMKYLSMGLIAVLFVIFMVVFEVYEHKTTRISLEGFDITLPASMRSVDDRSFETQRSKYCKSFSNSKMEFTCVKYDAKSMIPDLGSEPENSDIDGMKAYYEAQSQLEELDATFIDELDDAFAKDLKEYKLIKKEKGRITFTYNDNAMVDNYVDMRLVVEGESLYQFDLLCSEEQKNKMSKDFDKIFKSIEMQKNA